MASYRVIELQTTKEGIDAQAITAYEEKNNALMAYHQALASCYASESLQAFCVMVVNFHGGVEARDYYDGTNAPEPNEDEEG